MQITIRLLTSQEDVAALNSFIKRTSETLCSAVYSPEQLAVLNNKVFGVHDNDGAVEDQSIFIAEIGDRIIACGGWSKRFFPSAGGGLLNPSEHPARMRTFFVDPEFNGLGLATLLLKLSENAALANGFCTAVLYATPNAAAFYAKYGYANPRSIGPGISRPLLDGQKLEFKVMDKARLVEHDLALDLGRLASNKFNVEFNLEVKKLGSPAAKCKP
jgi:GNAT superfamily N-acetyltransferase